jgi:hypothetical protein
VAAERRLAVEPERLAGWLDRFADRHGGVAESTADPLAVTVTAGDGAVAECRVPFPPLVVDPAEEYGGLVGHALADRRVGVLLVRLGGHAAGVFAGDRLVASKVGARQVHGRSAAGGQSQQRFARRREGQVRVALAAAADVAAAVLVPVAPTLDAVVLGGDRRAVDAVLADPRLAPLRPLVVEARIDVPDPRLKVLQGTPALFRAVRIRVADGTRDTP